jgi:hypothetical protein
LDGKVITERKSKPMFAESRGILFVFSPVLGVFFVACAYFVHFWEPISIADKVGKGLVLEILASFLMLCGVGFIASIIGPERMTPLITRVGGKAIVAGLLIILGCIVVLLYYGLTS